MILEGINTHLRTDLGFKEPKEVLKQDDNADQNYFIIVNNT